MSSTSHKTATEMHRPPTMETSPKQSSNVNVSSSAVATQRYPAPLSSPEKSSEARHQRIVLADPVAFSYLEDDKSTTVLERSRRLEGYQSYVVEQWACSRTHPTFVIAAYTGDATHTIVVGILSVSAREDKWSPRLKAYFKALTQYHARQRETPLGILMVTNLSGFPSSLTIVPVPDGNITKHREEFIVNEDLKRLGCSGRVGLTMLEPTAATKAKFHQIYRTSEKIPLYGSVLELVKLCQVALMLFDRLEPDYADGLLCDVTERALNDWWAEIGMELYNVEPNDGVLGPTTVAALLGTLIGARNRLQIFGAPVTKDVFDIAATKSAISYFQKAVRLPRTRRLDRATINRLHAATAKQASGDGWGVPKAVKSTVVELSGKGGEMVLDMVTRNHKKHPAEIETVDIDRFVQLIKGDRAKWLWQGKARRRMTRDLLADTVNDDRITFKGGRVGQEKIPELSSPIDKSRRREARPSHRKQPSQISIASDTVTEDPGLRPTVLRRTTGRLRDAVRIRGHQSTQSKDATLGNLVRNKSVDTLSSVESIPPAGLHDAYKSLPSADHTTSDNERDPHPVAKLPSFTKSFTDTPIDSRPDLFGPRLSTHRAVQDVTRPSTSVSPSRRASHSPAAPENPTSSDTKVLQLNSTLLQRTQSFSAYETTRYTARNENYYPRHLSFSVAEDSVLHTPGPSELRPRTPPHNHFNPRADLHAELLKAAPAKHLSAAIAALALTVGAWTVACLTTLAGLLDIMSADADQLALLYHPRKEEHASLSAGAAEVVVEERARLTEAVRDVETFGAKLEYEVGALRGKVEDVEDAVGDFEKQVVATERRVDEMTRVRDRRGWWEVGIGWLGGFSGRQTKEGG